MAEHLGPEEEILLQSALSTAFTPIPVTHQSVHQEPAESHPEPAPAEPVPLVDLPAPSNAEPESADSLWRAEYEQHVSEWRQRSAEQRKKAEEERARWEAIREQERRAASDTDTASAHGRTESGWESLGASGISAAGEGKSPSPVDTRDLVTGEHQGKHTKEYVDTILPGPSHPRGASEPDSKHERWEDIPSSLASSYPSMSFPSDPHSPSSDPHRLHPHHHAHHHERPGDHRGAGHAQDVPPSTTLAVFDSTLSPKTRVLALLSSLAINFFLPFLNGVMLGCGEMFAKHVVVRWLGWPVSSGPGSVAASVGLGKSRGKGEDTRNRQ